MIRSRHEFDSSDGLSSRASAWSAPWEAARKPCGRPCARPAAASARSRVLPRRVRCPSRVAAEARQFTGEIEDFGPLEKEQKKQIRKALRVMCRECQMGVAVAQLALDRRRHPSRHDRSRSDRHQLRHRLHAEPAGGIQRGHPAVHSAATGNSSFPAGACEGLPKMSPLWLLKYLPNMPASHVAIFNDLRGPSNSLTMREAGSNLAVGEAYQIIRRGNADAMVCGATGTRLHAMKIVHAVSQEEVAGGGTGDPAKVSRPFDRNRSGMVLGEGAGAIVIEELAHAQARGATIYGEIVAASSRAAAAPRLARPAQSWPWPTCCGRCCKTPVSSRTRSITSTPMD